MSANKNDQKAIFRIIDANFNRILEGLRVLEEIVRFILEQEEYLKAIKDLRYKLKKQLGNFEYNLLLDARESQSDIGSLFSTKEEISRRDVKELFIANIRRCQEGMRVLEEFVKLTTKPEISNEFKRMRFELYSMEKSLGYLLNNVE